MKLKPERGVVEALVKLEQTRSLRLGWGFGEAEASVLERGALVKLKPGRGAAEALVNAPSGRLALPGPIAAHLGKIPTLHQKCLLSLFYHKFFLCRNIFSQLLSPRSTLLVVNQTWDTDMRVFISLTQITILQYY